MRHFDRKYIWQLRSGPVRDRASIDEMCSRDGIERDMMYALTEDVKRLDADYSRLT